jgi:hypothetical protein
LKPTLLIPPLVALVIAAVWLGNQHQSLSALEQESVWLEKHIAATHSSSASFDSSQAGPTSFKKSEQENVPQDWAEIAKQLDELEGDRDIGTMRMMLKLQLQVMEMGQDELVAALDDISALDLSEESRKTLESLLIESLIGKDPELALTKGVGHLQGEKGLIQWQLSRAFTEWTKKDPAKSSSWLDQQIAEGKFDSKSLKGRNPSLIEFEATLIHHLISSDLNAAANRLKAMPDKERDNVLRNADIQEKDQSSFAKLVREHLSEKDQARTLAKHATDLITEEDGYSKVTAYLDRIQATPAERAKSARDVAESKFEKITNDRKVTREDVDEMRKWVGTQAPSGVGSATGKALNDALQGPHKMEFSEVADLALYYHQSSPNDDMLVELLDSKHARKNKTQALILAEKISDPVRRQEILEKLK